MGALEFNSNKVKGLLAENNYTQKDLSEKLNISCRALNRKLSDQNDFKVSELAKICTLFKVNPAIFFVEEVSREDITSFNN